MTTLLIVFILGVVVGALGAIVILVHIATED